MTSANDAYFRKEIGITNFEWFDVLFFSWDFRSFERKRNEQDEGPDWTAIKSLTFEILSDDPNEQGNVLVDAVAFREIAGGALRKAPAKG